MGVVVGVRRLLASVVACSAVVTGFPLVSSVSSVGAGVVLPSKRPTDPPPPQPKEVVHNVAPAPSEGAVEPAWPLDDAALLKAPPKAWGRSKGPDVDDSGVFDVERVPRGQAKKQLGSLPIAFSLGDGELLAKKNGKVPPGQQRKAVRFEIRKLGKDARAERKLGELAFEIAPVDVPVSEPVVVRAEIDYAQLGAYQGGDWAARLGVSEFGALLGPGGRLVASENDLEAQVLTIEFIVNDQTPVEPDPAFGDMPEAAIPDPPTLGGAEPRTTSPVADEADDAAAPAVVGSTAGGSAQNLLRSGSASYSAYSLSAGYVSQFGSFAATPGNLSSEWAVGLQSGTFDWSYQVPMPETGWGTAPAVSLGYSSGSIDGLVPDKNNQGGSLLGNGWSLGAGGHIERSFLSCRSDVSNVGWQIEDLCWYTKDGEYERLSIVLNGRSEKLIPINGSGIGASEFRLESDPLWRVQRLVGAGGPDGGGQSPNDVGEYWVVTTRDGVKYFFGANAQWLNSTWEVPVYANDPGEPCYGTPSTPNQDRFCTQAWRWNLDKIEDPNGNVTEFNYVPEHNTYARFGGYFQSTYTRGGYLAWIRWGRQDAVAPHLYRGRVLFNIAERCITTTQGGSGCVNDPSWVWPYGLYYPDAPTNMHCATNCTLMAPSFFTTKVLDSVDVSQCTAPGGCSGTGWETVDRINLKYEWADPDGNAANAQSLMFLRYIERVGYTGTRTASGAIGTTSTVLNKIRFDAGSYNNRADSLATYYWRVNRVTDERGTETNVVYGLPHGCMPAPYAWNANATDCFPRWGIAQSGSSWVWGWVTLNKYLVLETEVREPTQPGAGYANPIASWYPPLAVPWPSPPQKTFYHYFNGFGPYPGSESFYVNNDVGYPWHHDNNPMAPASLQSWGDYRGWNKVSVVNGTSQWSDHFFYRGTYGDKASSSGGTRTTTVQYPDGSQMWDIEWMRGIEFLTLHWDAGQQTKRTFMFPHWVPTSASSMWHTVAYTVEQVRPPNGAWMSSKTTLAYDPYGNVTEANSDGGTPNHTPDDRCTVSLYTVNLTNWILDRPNARATRQGGCGGTQMAWTAFFYDNQPHTTAPIRGNLNAQIDSIDGVNWALTAQLDLRDSAPDPIDYKVKSIDGPLANDTVTTTYDAYGMPETVTNGLGHVTTTVWRDKLRYLPLKVTDANNKPTSMAYDGLGRLSEAWAASEHTGTTRDATQTATFSYAQDLSWVKTSALISKNPTVVRAQSAVFNDRLGQAVQSQRPSPVAGQMIVNSTSYDELGRAHYQTADYPMNGTAGVGLTGFPSFGARYTRTDRDDLDRPRNHIEFAPTGAIRRFTEIQYAGLVTTVVPPGAVNKTTTIANWFGEPVETRRYTDSTNFAASTMTYDGAGRVKTITDPAAAVTTYTYNLLGHPTQVVDPYSGTTTTEFDPAGNPTKVTNANGTINTSFDGLSRPTSRSVNGGPMIASWAYDAAGQKGLLDYTVAFDETGKELYRTDIVGYDSVNRPTATRYIVAGRNGWTTFPDGANLSGTYQFDYGHDLAGNKSSITYPATPGQSAETVTTSYDQLDNAVQLDGAQSYVSSTTFESWGSLKTRKLGNAASPTSVLRTYEWYYPHGSLTSLKAERTTAGNTATIQHLVYGYNDNLGVVSEIQDQIAPQKQCFRYDNWNRLIAAYSTDLAIPCDPAAGSLNGPGPYNHRYSYDTANRTVSFGPTNATWTAGLNVYAYANAARPFAVSSIATPYGTDSYTYDPVGNRTSFTDADGPDATYAWDTTGRLTRAGQTANLPVSSPTHRATTQTSTGTPASTSLTLTRPAGTVAGDVLVASIVTSTAAAITAPTGWVQAARKSTTGTTTTVYARTATGSDPSNWVFTFATSTRAAGGLSAYTGADPTSPIEDVATNTNTSPTVTVQVSQSVDTVGPNRTLITITGTATGTTTTPHAGMTERADTATTNATGNVTVHTADQAIAVAGTTGTRTATSATPARSTTVTIALTAEQVTSNLHDIDRQRVLRKDPNGDVTLYIAGLIELRRVNTTATVTSTRYYNIGATNVASQTGSNLTWILGDVQGSVSTTITNTATPAVAQQYYSPYGNTRATSGTPPTDHTFLNQTTDKATNLNYLNNRYHDPTTGTFLSVDPLVAQTGQAYVYGAANPVTFTDPTGLEPGSWNNTSREYWVWQFFWKKTSAELKAINERVKQFCQGGCSQPPRKKFENVGNGQFQVFDSPEEVEHEYLDDASELLNRRLAGQDTGVGLPPGGGFIVGVTSGFCYFFCLELGVSDEGPYIKPGIGLAIDSPGVVWSQDSPKCGSEQTDAYVVGGVGPVSAGYTWTSPGRSGEWKGSWILPSVEVPSDVQVPRYKALSAGGGVIHSWTFC
jgi:RHS repeat-associated protein